MMYFICLKNVHVDAFLIIKCLYAHNLKFYKIRKTPSLVYFHNLYQLFHLQVCCNRGLAKKEKNSAFCMNWEMKRNWGSGEHWEPLSGFSGRPGTKPL